MRRKIFDGNWPRLGEDLRSEARGVLRVMEDEHYLCGELSGAQVNAFMSLSYVLWELFTAMGGNPQERAGYEYIATRESGGILTLGGAQPLSKSTEIISDCEGFRKLRLVYALWDSMYKLVFYQDPALIKWAKEALTVIVEETKDCHYVPEWSRG